MAITPRLEQRQSQTQSLVMTPQLQQAIKLLQMSSQELTTFIEGELEQNPLLERDDSARNERGEGTQEPTASGDEALPDSAEFAANETLPGSEGDPADTNYENLWSSGSTLDRPAEGAEAFGNWGSGGRTDFTASETGMEQSAPNEISLRDHLLGQLTVDVADPADVIIGTHLIDMLDEAGYFTGDMAALAELLGCPVSRVAACMEKLRAFDPPGVFALNLADCLALQLKEKDRLDPAMEIFLQNLDMLGRRDLKGLMRKCGVDEEDIKEMAAEIRALDPKPAMAFEHNVAQTVVPDVLMRPLPKGGWLVELNNETLPRVLLNTQYYTKVIEGAKDKKEKEYIAERFNSASWLVKSLDQRATTILKVASEIVRQQDAFFVHGVQHLKPLILRNIAEAIGMHESTVSRVTTNKFIATPRGTYELKYFFTSAIGGTAGEEAHSAEAVRHRIREMIDNESAERVLSDDQIVDILRAEGIDIARRTVAKYREAMHIPSSVQRRRDKQAEL